MPKKSITDLSDGELSQRARVRNKVKDNYRLPEEYKRQKDIEPEVNTALQIFYRKNKPESMDINYLLNMDER